MMRSKNNLLWASFVTLVICLSCGGNDELGKKPDPPVIIDVPIDDDFQTNPQDIDTEGAVLIVFNQQSVSVTNPFEEKGVTITHQEAHVVVQSTSSDTIRYILTGSTLDGSLKIYSDVQYELIMNGISIVSTDDPALNIQSHRKTTITLVDGTSNRFVGGMGFISEGGDEKIKAAFFSRGQIVLAGAGGLTVISRYRHAICSDNYIRITGGVITIPLSANDGLHANDYIEINDGTIEVNAMGDGMDSEGYVLITGGSIKITTTGDKSHGIKSETDITVQTSDDIDIHVQGDASKAFRSKGDMLITQGNLNLTTTGDACYDDEEADISSTSGIKCRGNLVIDGGHIVINSSGLGGKGISVDGTLTINDGVVAVTTTGDKYKLTDDNTKAKAIKNDEDLILNGGLIYADSKTDNALDTKGSLLMTGGTVIGIGRDLSKKGIECKKTFKISGGTLVGIGGESSLPTASACTQYVVNYAGEVTQNAFVDIASSAGKDILTFRSPCTLSKAFILFSSSELELNMNYSIWSGGSVTGGESLYGLYSDATYSGGTVRATFMVSTMVMNVN